MLSKLTNLFLTAAFVYIYMYQVYCSVCALVLVENKDFNVHFLYWQFNHV